MVGRISISAVAFAVVLMASSAGSSFARPDVLVSYSFDDQDVATGPDTFAVFEKARGRVNLSTTFRHSGYHSVEIRDVSGDGQFPELQGYFPLRRSGELYAHFAILTTDAMEPFNIALAGPQWFSLRADGIGFWLEARDGILHHHSDSMPKQLFPLRGFVWYVVDLRYRVDEGLYDLVIHEEGVDEPIIDLRDQPNASARPRSAVDKFSFIGDRGEDTSNVVYYVDDVIVSADEPVDLPSLVAPGRRKMFIDAWLEYERLALSRPGCLPAADLRDLGIDFGGTAALRHEKGSSPLELLTRTPATRLARDPALKESTARLLEAVDAWSQGCAHLKAGRPRRALGEFERAARLAPDGRIYHLSIVLALAALGRWEEVDSRIDQLRSDWDADPRFPVAIALIGLARGDLEETMAALRANDPQAIVSNPWVAEQAFFVHLWNRSYRDAENLALQMAQSLGASTAAGARWIGYAGDVAHLQGDHEIAKGRYEQALEVLPDDRLLWTHLADIYHRLGDVRMERECRERIYGSLRDDRPD